LSLDISMLIDIFLCSSAEQISSSLRASLLILLIDNSNGFCREGLEARNRLESINYFNNSILKVNLCYFANLTFLELHKVVIHTNRWIAVIVLLNLDSILMIDNIVLNSEVAGKGF